MAPLQWVSRRRGDPLLTLSSPDILATLDKEHLLTERDRLNLSLNQTWTKNINLTEERDELQARFDALDRKYNKSKLANRKLRRHFRGGTSCY